MTNNREWVADLYSNDYSTDIDVGAMTVGFGSCTEVDGITMANSYGFRCCLR